MAVPKREPVTIPISGYYEVSDNKMIVVYYAGKKSEPKEVAGLHVYAIAQNLLDELSRDTPPALIANIARLRVV